MILHKIFFDGKLSSDLGSAEVYILSSLFNLFAKSKFDLLIFRIWKKSFFFARAKKFTFYKTKTSFRYVFFNTSEFYFHTTIS